MRKRAVSLLLMLVLVIGLFPAVHAATTDSGLEYEVCEDHVEITGYTGDATELVIPSEIEGLPVTSIGEFAFEECESLTSIDIPDSVTSIGSSAFAWCDNLTRIDLPNSITKIDEWTFYNSFRLTSITIPDSVTVIGKYAFSGCSRLTSISIPDSVIEIGDYAFFCKRLTTIYFNGDAPRFSDNVFRDGSLLDTVTATAYYPVGNPTWIEDVMQDYGGKITWLPHTHAYEAVVTVPTCTEHGYTTYTCVCGDSYVDDYVDALGHDMRSFVCTAGASVCLREGCNYTEGGPVIHKFGEWFVVTAPTCTVNGEEAHTCVCGESATRAVPSVGHSWSDSICVNCGLLSGFEYWIRNGTVTITGYTGDATEVVIPAQIEGFPVTEINGGAFAYCSALISIVIPEGVTKIGSSAFDARGAFYNCTSLSSIVLPDSLTYIGTEAFYGCSSLTSIVIPDGVTFIGSFAFYGCTNLTSITFRGDAPEFEWKPSYDNSSEVFWTEVNFGKVTATAYYPADNPTWTKDVMRDYGGNITWVPYTRNPFTDVKHGDFYYKAVLWALENNITTGATADTFNPNGQCLRAQVVTFLHRAARNPEPTRTNNPFTDVKTGDFFYKPVLWAVEKNITNGVSATKFGSYDVCNRAAVVTFLWRAAGSPTPSLVEHPFTDVPDGAFYEKAVLWALENGITQGISATEFGPTANCNRAQVVTFLYRAYN